MQESKLRKQQMIVYTFTCVFGLTCPPSPGREATLPCIPVCPPPPLSVQEILRESMKDKKSLMKHALGDSVKDPDFWFAVALLMRLL